MPTQKPSTKFANALLFSLALHLAVWIAFLIWGEPFSARPLPKTTVTFVTLTPRLGNPQAPMKTNAEPSSGEPGPAALTPAASPEAPKSEAPIPKKVEPAPKKNDPVSSKKSNTANVKSTPKSNPPKKDSKTAKSPSTSKKTNTDQAPVKKTSTSSPANSDSNSQKAAQPSAADQKMASALANIQKDLNQRGGAGTGTGSSGGAGGGGSGSSTGNAGTAGVSGGDPNSPEYKGYQASIKSKVTGKWFRPNNPDGVKRRTVVKVRIDGSGNVTSKSIRKSSGDASFDNSVLRAIEQASPFPMPPSSVRDEAVNDGFAIEMVGR